MEATSNETKFYGDGGKYLGILAANFILTIITLGIYYPWARAKNLQYIYGETEFSGNRLMFHGTGREMFKGFIKAVAIIIILYLIYTGSILSRDSTITIAGILIFLLGMLLLIPLAIHGGMRYRMSRTSWKGIHFGYRGSLRELFGIWFKGIFFTIITFGIYTSWFGVNLRKYLIGNVRLGNLKFSFDGEGGDLFLINLKFGILLYLTLGIYTFWYLRNRNHFYINNIKVEQDDNVMSFRSTLTPSDVFKITLTNALIVIFTLGIGIPWAIIRHMRMIFNNIELEGAFNPDTIIQTEESYADATGDDLLSMLDIGFDF